MNSRVRIDGNRLHITRLFDAPRERVFEAWKDVDQLQQWWGCEGIEKVESTIDFRAGGTFTHKMQIKDCGQYVYSGAYDEIVEPARIAYHAENRGNVERVTVDFVEEGDMTSLILVQEGFADAEACQIVSRGFTAAFDSLDRVLSTPTV